MWVPFRRVRKRWFIYCMISALSCYVLFKGTDVIIRKSIHLLEQKLRPTPKYPTGSKFKEKVQIVVGHYLGPGNLFGNITKDILNINLYSPVEGEGENGKPVVVPARDVLKMQQLFQINRFNVLASDRISLNRTLPDVRKRRCHLKEYPVDLPTTSVIIVFHNEAWSVLLRTVWSVINRSPRSLLADILLVDDASEREYLKAKLEEYVATLPVQTRVLRLAQREGLVSARLLGAKYATGEVLTFLDAHCECSPGWLEPLLAQIRLDRRKVVCPVIDIISDDNFGYIKSFEFHWGAFNWDLHFRWLAVGTQDLQKRKNDITVPFATPAMAGGLFAIERNYFYEIGSYDAAMKIWGGDNLEMSFRIWQCGGEIEIVPCSHVGHLFRKSSPYTFPGGVNDVLHTNLARLALVWMDKWKDFYFYFNPAAKKIAETLDVSDRIELRHSLQCKSFDWYLKNVWPVHFFPTDNRFFGKLISFNSKGTLYDDYVRHFRKQIDYNANLSAERNWEILIEILNRNTSMVISDNAIEASTQISCVQKPIANGLLNQHFGQAYLRRCGNRTKLTEMFVITQNGQIMTDENICLDANDHITGNINSSLVKITICVTGKRQRWMYNWKTLQIVHVASSYCLETGEMSTSDMENQNPALAKRPMLIRPCDSNALKQKWMLHSMRWR